MTSDIMNYTIIKNSQSARGHQYCVKLKFENGTEITRRLSGFFPTADKFENETQKFQNKAHLAVLNIIQDLQRSGPPVKGKYQTCDTAMNAYLDHYQDTRKRQRYKFQYHGQHFIKHFGNMRLSRLDDAAARGFAEALIESESNYSFDTVRLAVAFSSGMVEFLRDHDNWSGPNPFHGILRRYAHRFPPPPPRNSRISDEDWARIKTAIQDACYRQAALFIETARCTGLRPEEIYNLDIKNLDRQSASWTFTVTKTKGRTFNRSIAVPPCLITFLDATGVNGSMPSETTTRRHLRKLSTDIGIKLTPKMFRKDFACRMEEAGASPDMINLHQGRAQTGVLYQHYITDPNRAVRLCRPYIDKMFDESEGKSQD
jgi:integrase